MSRATDWPDFQEGGQTTPGRELFPQKDRVFKVLEKN